MLFWCYNLVHVSSKPGVQRDLLDFACFHQGIILPSGVTQHLSVHCIRNLQEDSFRKVWFVLIQPVLREQVAQIQSSRAKSSRDLCTTRQKMLGIPGESVVHLVERKSQLHFSPPGLDLFAPCLGACLLELTSIQLLCFCCIFPFRRGPIMSLRSEWRVSITRLAKICTEKAVKISFWILLLHFLLHVTKKNKQSIIVLLMQISAHEFKIKTQPLV